MAWYIETWERRFPRTVGFLRDGFPAEARVPRVWEAFRSAGALPEDAAVKATNFSMDSNAPPLIWFTDLGNRAGEFSVDHPNRIEISALLADQFEKFHDGEDARQYLSAKILHEMVHWSLCRNGMKEPEEMGVAFEKQAFAEPLTPFWLDDAARLSLRAEIAEPLQPAVDPAIRKLEPGDFGNKDLAAALPRGIRNNNPGNIRRSSAQWEGLARPDELKPFQIGETSFCVFSDALFGIRAMAVILRNYQDRIGLKTVSAMINRWAPPSDNNTTDEYIRTVSSVMGVSGNQEFNFRDEGLGTKMLRAMIKVENGMQPYSQAQLSRGHAKATL